MATELIFLNMSRHFGRLVNLRKPRWFSPNYILWQSKHSCRCRCQQCMHQRKEFKDRRVTSFDNVWNRIKMVTTKLLFNDSLVRALDLNQLCKCGYCVKEGGSLYYEANHINEYKPYKCFMGALIVFAVLAAIISEQKPKEPTLEPIQE